jgi:hypothetical protein
VSCTSGLESSSCSLNFCSSSSSCLKAGLITQSQSSSRAAGTWLQAQYKPHEVVCPFWTPIWVTSSYHKCKLSGEVD